MHIIFLLLPLLITGTLESPINEGMGGLLNSTGVITNTGTPGTTVQIVDLLFQNGNSSGLVKVSYDPDLGYYYQIQTFIPTTTSVKLNLLGSVSADCLGANIGIQQLDIGYTIVSINITGINQSINYSGNHESTTEIPTYIAFISIPPKCKVSFNNVDLFVWTE